MEFPISFIRRSKAFATPKRSVPAPYLRRTFTVEKPVAEATLLITGLGFYEAHVNGENITKGYLSPYRSNPDHIIYYDQYALADRLKPGKNVLALLLGNGLQNSRCQHWWFEEARWRGAPQTAFSLALRYEDGTEETILSDTSVRTADSPIVMDDVHLGEHYDARLEIDGWNLPEFDDSGWDFAEEAPCPRGETRLCEVEPIVVRSTRSPVNIIKNDEGWLYDFGVNTAGIFRLNIDGDEGQQVDLLFGEVREGDRLVLDNIHCGPDDRFQEDRYICNGKGTATYSPHFTYHGYQYAQVNGLRDDQAVPELLTCIEMSCDIPTIGEFSCSDTVINRVQEATLRSDICNFYHFPTDCPQREKNGWTADASLSAEQVLLNLKPENCYRIWLHNIYKAMHDDGQLPGIVPTDRWGYHWGNGPAWDNVLVLLPYYTYRYRGDRRILEEAATPILRYLQYLYTRLDENELMCIGLGDWNHAGRRCDQYEAPLIVTDSILTVEIAEKAAFIYRVLGMSAQEQFAATLATTVRNAFRRHLIDFETGIVHGNCQTCQAMALHYGMFEAEEKPLAFNYLLKLVERADNHLDAGVLGGRVLFRVLADFGMTELAYHMIVRPDFPSYGNWIARGATTLWETFYPEGGTPSSLNHCFWGDISAWFYIYLGGIRLNPDGDDIHRLDIAPVFIESLTYAKASHRSVDGDITVYWERTEDGFRLEVTAPDAAHGSILLPTEYCFENGVRQLPLSCGVYHCHKESCV